MAESRFERWSRLKSEARQESSLSAEEIAQREATEAAQQEQERTLADNEQLSDEEILEKYELPDPDKIELGMDIKGFMNKEVPEALRRRALRSLWRSNPVLAVLDGLNDYDEDYNTIRTGAGGVQTLYRVGKGMFDKALRAEEQLQQASEMDSEIQSEVPSVGSSVRPPENESSIEAHSIAEAAENEKELTQIEAQEELETYEESSEPAPVRYRPRMSFR